MNATTTELIDVLIIGAGVSGIGCASYLQRHHPQRKWTILEARNRIGGTWDLFKYPGIRSDSDLYTFSYEFKPWASENSIASADEILSYLDETVEENDLGAHISFNRKALSADWNHRAGVWTVKVENTVSGETEELQTRWLFGAAGYYKYDEGFRPDFEGEGNFKGDIIHPQFWPDDFDYSGKKIAVIGSGATAVTIVPSMTDKAEHVTQIQRTPTYIVPRPKKDKLALKLRKWLPEKTAHALIRWKNIRIQRLFFLYCQKFPDHARKTIMKMNKRNLPADYPTETHFTPPYNPWDQRLCAVPDADFFKDLRNKKASVVTGQIERFTETGVQMVSGEHIEADAIILATGLKLQMFGGVQLTIAGEMVTISEHLVYRGMMLDGVPNFCFAQGYTNSSWTLKVGLVCEHFCDLLTEMDKQGALICTPEKPADEQDSRPLLDFDAGYVKRAASILPKQGQDFPWEMNSSYIADKHAFKSRKVLQPELKLTSPPAAISEAEVA
ncbi:MAG: FAD-containing monooxygenase EthA [Ponticaulis sp.]|nr:FAD-containing monooxygenase EthA [Ponticaulis sp.]